MLGYDERSWTMRVIAGSCKGRRIAPPRWDGLRPSSDRLRETLFNILGDAVIGRRVMDGCAGTGAMGIEALSRGAAHVVFVDVDQRSVSLIRRNVVTCGLLGRCVIVEGALPKVFDQFAQDLFDLILLDPPYGANTIGGMLAGALSCLEKQGIMVLERTRKQEINTSPMLEMRRSVRVGNSVLDFFARVDGRSSLRHVVKKSLI